MNPLIEFEDRFNLNARQVARLLAIPTSTYYQYRREDDVPTHAVRTLAILNVLSKPEVDKVIAKYVHGRTTGVADDEL